MTNSKSFQDLLDKGSFEKLYDKLHVKTNSIDETFTLIEACIFIKKYSEGKKLFSAINPELLDQSQIKTYSYLKVFILHVSEDFKAALTQADKVLSNFSLSLREKINLLIEESFCFRKLGKITDALNCLTPYQKDIISLSDFYKGYFYNSLGLIYWNKGDLSKSLDIFKECLLYYQNIGYSSGIARAYNNLANVYNDLGDLDKSFDNYSSSLDINLKANNEFDLAITYNNIAVIKQKKGLLGEAIEYYEKSLKLMKSLENKTYEAVLHSNIGSLESDRGNYSLALYHLNLSSEYFSSLYQLKHLAMTLSVISEVYFSKGEYDRGKKEILKSITIKNKIGNNLDTLISIYTLFWYDYSFGKENDSEIIELFNALSQKQIESKNVEIYIKLIHTILELEKNNFSGAKSILSDIKNEEGIEFNHKIIALKSLAIAELELWKQNINERNYTNITDILHELIQLCQSNNLSSWYCEILIIQAKFEDSIFQFTKSVETLTFGLEIARKSGLMNYESYFIKEIEQQTEKAKIVEPLKKALNYVDIDDLKQYLLTIKQLKN